MILKSMEKGNVAVMLGLSIAPLGGGLLTGLNQGTASASATTTQGSSSSSKSNSSSSSSSSTKASASSSSTATDNGGKATQTVNTAGLTKNQSADVDTSKLVKASAMSATPSLDAINTSSGGKIVGSTTDKKDYGFSPHFVLKDGSSTPTVTRAQFLAKYKDYHADAVSNGGKGTRTASIWQNSNGQWLYNPRNDGGTDATSEAMLEYVPNSGASKAVFCIEPAKAIDEVKGSPVNSEALSKMIGDSSVVSQMALVNYFTQTDPSALKSLNGTSAARRNGYEQLLLWDIADNYLTSHGGYEFMRTSSSAAYDAYKSEIMSKINDVMGKTQYNLTPATQTVTAGDTANFSGDLSTFFQGSTKKFTVAGQVNGQNDTTMTNNTSVTSKGVSVKVPVTGYDNKTYTFRVHRTVYGESDNNADSLAMVAGGTQTTVQLEDSDPAYTGGTVKVQAALAPFEFTKTGEGLNGTKVVKDSKTGKDVTEFTYGKTKLSGVKFNVTQNGKVVDTVTTDSNGVAKTSKPLALGKYHVEEISAPSGYDITKPVAFDVNVTQADADAYNGKQTYKDAGTYANNLQKVNLSIFKKGETVVAPKLAETEDKAKSSSNSSASSKSSSSADSSDSSAVKAFSASDTSATGDSSSTGADASTIKGANVATSADLFDTKDVPMANVTFGVYNASDIKAGDTDVKADTLLGVTTTDKDGKASLSDVKLPVNGKYYVKELSTGDDEHVLKDTKYNFNYDGSNNASQTIYVYGDGTSVDKENSKLTPIDNRLDRKRFVLKKFGELFNNTNNSDKFVNEDSAQAESAVAGAVFTLKDAKGQDVQKLTIDKSGDAVSGMLPYGKYTLQETTPPQFYKLNDTKYDVTVNKKGVTLTDPNGKNIAGDVVDVSKLGQAKATATKTLDDFVTVYANKSGKTFTYTQTAGSAKMTRADAIKAGYKEDSSVTTDQRKTAEIAGQSLLDQYNESQVNTDKSGTSSDASGSASASSVSSSSSSSSAKADSSSASSSSASSKDADTAETEDIGRADTNKAEEFTVNNKLKKGQVDITKNDVSTGKEVAGAKISITGVDNKTSLNYTTGTSDTKFTLPEGTYKITETKAPKGYTASQESGTFTIKDDKIVKATLHDQQVPKTGATNIWGVLAGVAGGASALLGVGGFMLRKRA